MCTACVYFVTFTKISTVVNSVLYTFDTWPWGPGKVWKMKTLNSWSGFWWRSWCFVEVFAKYDQIWYRIEWSGHLGTWILRKGTRDWVFGAWGQPWWHSRSLLQSWWRSRSITIIWLELYQWMFKARVNNKEDMRTAFNQKIYITFISDQKTWTVC